MEVAMEDVQDHSESAPVMSSEHSEQDQGHEDTPDLNSPNAANVSTPSFSTLSPTGVPNQENLSNNPEESPMEQRNQPSMFRTFTFSYDFATAERARNGAMPNRSISFAEGDAATPSHGSSGLFRGSQRVLNRSMSSFTQDGSRQGHGDLQSRSNSMLLGVSPIRQRHISPMPRSRSSVGYRYRRALPVSSGSEMERLSTSFPGSSFDTGLISPLTQQHRYNDNFSDNLSRDNTTVSSTPSEGLPPNSRQQQEHAERQDSWYRISSSFVRLFRAVSNDVTNTDLQQQQQQEQTQDRPDASNPITTTAATATRNIVPSDTAPATAAPSPQHQHQHQHRSPQQSNTAINARCPSFSEDGDPEDLLWCVFHLQQPCGIIYRANFPY